MKIKKPFPLVNSDERRFDITYPGRRHVLSAIPPGSRVGTIFQRDDVTKCFGPPYLPEDPEDTGVVNDVGYQIMPILQRLINVDGQASFYSGFATTVTLSASRLDCTYNITIP